MHTITLYRITSYFKMNKGKKRQDEKSYLEMEYINQLVFIHRFINHTTLKKVSCLGNKRLLIHQSLSISTRESLCNNVSHVYIVHVENMF